MRQQNAQSKKFQSILAGININYWNLYRSSRKKGKDRGIFFDCETDLPHGLASIRCESEVQIL